MTDGSECGVAEEELSALYAALGNNLKAREILWRLEQGARGVHNANADLHAAIKAQHALVYREHLVEEVIRRYDERDTDNGRSAFAGALRRLVEWKP